MTEKFEFQILEQDDSSQDSCFFAFVNLNLDSKTERNEPSKYIDRYQCPKKDQMGKASQQVQGHFDSLSGSERKYLRDELAKIEKKYIENYLVLKNS